MSQQDNSRKKFIPENNTPRAVKTPKRKAGLTSTGFTGYCLWVLLPLIYSGMCARQALK